MTETLSVESIASVDGTCVCRPEDGYATLTETGSPISLTLPRYDKQECGELESVLAVGKNAAGGWPEFVVTLAGGESSRVAIEEITISRGFRLLTHEEELASVLMGVRLQFPEDRWTVVMQLAPPPP